MMAAPCGSNKCFSQENQKTLNLLGKKLGNVLRSGEINLEALEKYKGHESLPFEPGNYKTIAIKTIDYDGREAKHSKGVAEW